MIINQQKTIRPTQLQPQIYSVVNDLSKKKDYIIVIDKNNNPLCVIASYSLIENLDIDNETNHEAELIQDMNEYYSSMPSEEKELLNDSIDDLYEY